MTGVQTCALPIWHTRGTAAGTAANSHHGFAAGRSNRATSATATAIPVRGEVDLVVTRREIAGGGGAVRNGREIARRQEAA